MRRLKVEGEAAGGPGLETKRGYCWLRSSRLPRDLPSTDHRTQRLCENTRRREGDHSTIPRPPESRHLPSATLPETATHQPTAEGRELVTGGHSQLKTRQQKHEMQQGIPHAAPKSEFQDRNQGTSRPIFLKDATQKFHRITNEQKNRPTQPRHPGTAPRLNPGSRPRCRSATAEL